MRYLIDEDLSTDVARIGRRYGLDVESVHEIGREAWTDEQQLVQAALDGRRVVTGNRDDFAGLSARFLEEGRPHAGVLVVTESLRREGAARIAQSLVAFDRVRGRFSSTYLWDFLPPAPR